MSVLYGIKFVYTPIQLSEYQLRITRTRTQAALWGRWQARRFAAAKAKQGKGKQIKQDSPPVEEDKVVRVSVEDARCRTPWGTSSPCRDGAHWQEVERHPAVIIEHSGAIWN